MNKKRNFDRALLMVAPLTVGLLQCNAQAAPQYILTDLGTLTGNYSHGLNVNDVGQVAGFAYTPSNAAVRAALGLNGIAMQDLGTLGGNHSISLDINATGQQAGTSYTMGDLTTRAFRYAIGGQTDLGTLGGSNSRGVGINDNGDVVGASQITGNTAEHAFLHRNGVRSDLGTLGGLNSQANDVNAAGQVTGFADLAGNTSFHAFRWNNGTRQDLGTLGGSFSEGLRINNAGSVAGYATLSGDLQHHAALWVTGRAVRDLGTLGGTFSTGYGINTTGEVVGYSTNTADALRRAFFWNGTAMQDLNTLILPGRGWILTEAHGISDSGNITGLGTVTVTDTVNNTIRVEQHAYLLTPDKIAPVLTCPAAVSTAGVQPAGIGTAIATDNLDPAPVIANNRPVTFPNGATTVVWTVTDANGNRTTCNQLVTVTPPDTTPPVIAAQWTPSTPDGLNQWYKTKPTMLKWSVTDNESAITSRTGCLDSSVSTDTAGQSFTCTATSSGGVRPMVSTSIKLDGTPPTLTPPAAASGTLNGASTAPVTFAAPTAVDTLSGVDAVSLGCTPASGSSFIRGSTAVSCNASDNAGNTSTASFNVTVTDPSAPTITPVITGTAGTNGWYRSAATLSWNIVELESPETLVKTGCAGLSVATSTSSVGLTDSCSASSAGGNTAAISRTIKIDTSAPVLTAPAPVTAEATGPNGAAVTWPALAVNEQLSGLTASGVSCDAASGSTFPLGSRLVNCNASDQAGNTGSASFNVTVRDTTRPVLSLPAPITSSTTASGGTAVTYTATANDTVSGSRPVSCTPASGVNFIVGATTVTCSSSDLAGNTATGSFTVTVNRTATDTTPPVLSLPANIVTTATSAAGALVSYSASASDAVSGVRPVSCSPVSPSTFSIGTTTVNCSASDVAGNTANGSFTVTVNPQPDTTPPVLSLPANIVTTATSATGALVNYSASASDAVSGVRPVSCSPLSSSTFSIGTTTVNCSASDTAGNTANGSFTVTVNSPTTPTPPSVSSVDLRVTGSVSTATPRKGDTVTYTFAVANIGTGAAQAVTFSDILPTSLRFSTLTTSVGTCTRPTNNGGGTVNCTLNSLAAGSTATITISAKANVTGTIANTGIATTSSVDVNSVNNASTVTLTAR
ncbi:MAG: HYR domain-containing protein [Methylococcaceae bacterium]|nr:HYR domain-containing protein [Methylococcaceae bacterium]